jgi:hypothetical protein
MDGILVCDRIIYGAMVALIQHDVKRRLPIPLSSTWASRCWVLCTQPAGYRRCDPADGQSRPFNRRLFLIVGLINERRHTLELEEFGGLVEVFDSVRWNSLVVSFRHSPAWFERFFRRIFHPPRSFQLRVLGSPWFAGLASLADPGGGLLLHMFQKVFLVPSRKRRI